MKKILLFLFAAIYCVGSWAQSPTLTPNNAQRWYAEYKNYFEDDICTRLKPAYQAMSDEELQNYLTGMPEKLIEFAIKAKNDSWDSFEKDFRVQKFKPYSNPSRWANYLNVYQYSELQSPTGIIGSNEYIYLFLSDNVPDSIWISVDVVADNGSYALTNHPLFPGLNMFKLADTETERRMLFFDYKVDTDTTATSKRLSDYPEVWAHIEGGHVYGYYDVERHNDAMWREMLERQANDPVAQSYKGLQVKGERVLFHMFRSSLVNACPNTISDAIELWDETVRRQHRLMGVEQYYDRWNDIVMARSDNRGGGFYASPTFTYYDDYALPGMLPYDAVYESPGNLWTSAHEFGHVNQGAINMVGCTESSNNLFANMNVHLFGKTTTRGDGVAFCKEEYGYGTPFPARTSNPIGVARMYFQLYLYFHVAEKMPDFYPRLFANLRQDRLLKEYITYGRKDQLKFAEKCCEIAQMDLSEFFEAWGFFEPMSSLNIGDYATYLVTLTQEEIDESRARMQQYEKKGGHLIFIEDRIKPSKRIDGVDGYRLDFSNEFAIGKMGEYGQWSDYIDESVKAQGYYYTKTNSTIAIKEEEGAAGALGFKLYNAQTGELLDFNNCKTLNIPAGDALLKLRVVAAQADGSDKEIPFVAEFDDEKRQLEYLTSILNTVQSTTGKNSNNGKNIGYYNSAAINELNALYKEAKAAADNADQSKHTYKEWAELLNSTLQQIRQDPNARALLKNLDAYTITSASGSRNLQLCYDALGLKANTSNETATSNEAKRWMVECTGTPHHYFIKNKNGKYINGIELNVGAMCSGEDSSNAIIFKANYLDDGTLYFSTENTEIKMYLALDRRDNKIIGSRNLNKSSIWRVIRVENNNTAIEEVNGDENDAETIYDLAGRRIEKITQPGIYIVNGKKVLVK